MTERIIFAGGGGHALSLMEALPDIRAAYAYLAPAPAESMPVRYLGDDSAAEALTDSGFLFHIAFVYAGFPSMARRKSLIDFYDSIGARFASIIAPSAFISRNSHIGEGAAVLHGAVVNRAWIDRHAIVNSGAVIEHDCRIGANSFIGPGAVLGGAVTVGDNCFIGLGSRIRNGVTIAPGTTIGMGSLVLDDTTVPGTYFGNPLRRH